MNNKPHPVTPHKRFVPEDTHPNFSFVKTSFMMGTLYAICHLRR